MFGRYFFQIKAHWAPFLLVFSGILNRFLGFCKGFHRFCLDFQKF